MISTIKNKFIKVGVKSSGAEMASIKSVIDDLEYLWQGDPKYWGGQSPILFPIIGNVRDGKYKIAEEEYEISIPHGFAKTSEFALVEQTHDGLGYQLSATDHTLRQYPYRFGLNISYRLLNNKIIVTNTVRNLDNKTMYFSIGAHPAFNCPLYDNEIMEDYYLEFEKEESIHRLMVVKGFLSGEVELFLNNEKLVPLSKELFSRSAIILKCLKSNMVAIKSKNNTKQIKVEFDGFPYLGIWSSGNDAPFVCIEPWHGVTSNRNNECDFREKEGIMSLGSGKSFECQYNIII